MPKKKKTHEEYVVELAAINPNIEVIDEYVNSKTKILHKCKVDGYEWFVYPNHALRGSGCPVCSGLKKKTHEEYVAQVFELNPNIEVVGVYINSQTKILHRCKIDGYEWHAAPSHILAGYGCSICGGSTKKTHEQYVKELFAKNPNIIVLEQYINIKTPILHKCLIDGHEWHVSPNNVLSGKGCPKCSGTMSKTHEQYVEELKLSNPSIVAIDKYINHVTKIKHKCLTHDYEWEVSPARVLNGCGCPMCKKEKARNRLARTHNEYIEELVIINKNISVLGQYINAVTPIAHKCLICGWEWNVIPESLLRGHGCPQCNKCSKSKGEKIISEWLYSRNISYQKQKTFDECKDKIKLRFDFYLPDYNILIEYNGKQHYEPIEYFGGIEGFKSTIKRDNIKKEYCNQNNIFLFEIPYYSDLYSELEKLYNLIITEYTKKGVVI